MESVRRISENTQEMTEAIEGKACETLPCVNECTCGRLKNQQTSPQPSTVDAGTETCNDQPMAQLDTKALAEASRNLTQTLKKLSSEVLTARPESTPESSAGPSYSRRRPGTPGAIIESMQHHGKGMSSSPFICCSLAKGVFFFFRCVQWHVFRNFEPSFAGSLWPTQT